MKDIKEIKYTPWTIFIWTTGSIVVALGTVLGFSLSAQSTASNSIGKSDLAIQKVEAHKELTAVQLEDIRSSLKRIEAKL